MGLSLIYRSGFVQGPPLTCEVADVASLFCLSGVVQAIQDVMPYDELVRLGQECGSAA
ncbi:MAG: hypothetical protein KDI27_04750 [Gammaproteobacteria bacterium]|nr:hypothetical protein [Gammaproteobacteria bacterium]MCP5417538.1 hypothetical protein [Chromatiaceae bacterium]